MTDPRLGIGTKHCFCSGCGEYFTVPANYDLHRRSPGGMRACIPPGTITSAHGKVRLRLNARGLWSRAEGAFIPKPEPKPAPSKPPVVLCTEQNIPEWHAARRGRITASKAQLALARRGSIGRSNYVQDLVNDLEGVPNFDEDEPAPWFADGRYYESWAAGWYAFKFGVEPLKTGFIVHGDYSWLGCSPDRLIGDDGGVEIKYRKTLRTFKQHAALRANKSVQAQIQMSMYVTDRRWWDYVNYWRDDANEVEQGSCERIERDDAYIDNELLPAFVGLWQEVQALLSSHKTRYNSA